MLLELNKIPADGARIDRTYPAAAFTRGADDEFRVAAPVSLHIKVVKDKQRYRLAGQLVTTLELCCGRCVENFALPVDVAFDLAYAPHTVNTGEGEVEIEEDDLTTAYYRDDVIDLADLMREQFYLVLPMKPLCTEECRGLCPMCGTNLNRSSCQCVAEWDDPRLAPLKSLRGKLQS
jgi:uncharacterized protein